MVDYSKLSKEEKRDYLLDSYASLGQEGMESLMMEDDITRQQNQINKAIRLIRDAGAVETKDGFDISKVITPQDKEKYGLGISIINSVIDPHEYEWSPLPMEEKSWETGIEAIKGTAKDIGSDMSNLVNRLTEYMGYGVPIANLKADKNLWPLIEGPSTYETGEGGYRYNEPSISGDLPFTNWMNLGSKLDDEGWGFIGKSNVPPNNPFKAYADRARLLADIAIPPLAAITTKGRGIAPLVSKLPNRIKSTIGQVLPWLSGQGTFFPKYMGKTPKFRDDILGHLGNRKWWPFTTQPSTYRNWMLAAPTVGMAGTANKAYAEPLGTEDLISSWSEDSTPAVFDDVMTEKIRNFTPMASSALYTGPAEPIERREERGPGPWNEFRG